MTHHYTPPDGFPYYFDFVKDEDIDTLFSFTNTRTLWESIDEEKSMYRYAPGKWSIKQVIGHITDHERIKMFRAFQLSRQQAIELWGYDQNALINHSRFEEMPIDLLVTDWYHVRKASLSFISTLSVAQLNLKGQARQYEVTLRDFLKSIIGHERHHIKVMKERYL